MAGLIRLRIKNAANLMSAANVIASVWSDPGVDFNPASIVKRREIFNFLHFTLTQSPIQSLILDSPVCFGQPPRRYPESHNVVYTGGGGFLLPYSADVRNGRTAKPRVREQIRIVSRPRGNGVLR